LRVAPRRTERRGPHGSRDRAERNGFRGVRRTTTAGLPPRHHRPASVSPPSRRSGVFGQALNYLKTIRRVPRQVIWEITTACNLRCIHCEGSAGRRDPQELSTQEALDLCDDLAAEGCRMCNVSGGEPLMRRDWDVLCRRLADHGIQVTLVTNGTMLDETAIRCAVKAGVGSFALSLDGLKETHDRIRAGEARHRSNFEDVMAALGRLRSSNLLTAAITHFNRWNIGEIEKIHELLHDMGVGLWQVQVGLPIGRLREIGEPYMITTEQLVDMAGRIASLIRGGRAPALRVTDTIGYYTDLEPVLRGGRGLGVWTGCYAGILTAGIESNGDVKGCSAMPREFVAGNVRERPFHEIWRDEPRFAYNTRWQEEKLTGFCAGCAYRKVCRAGCTTLAFSVTGTIYENPYCLHRIGTLAGRRERSGP
jgi:radical SAM protein with 4Fe4S-binding SPASM domain